MARMRNKYCSNCLQTTHFLDLGDRLICEVCSKRLGAVAAPENGTSASSPAVQGGVPLNAVVREKEKK